MGNEPFVPEQMSVEQAQEILHEDLIHREEMVDNVYPWWQTLRRPFFLLSATIVVLCLSIIFMAITLRTLSDDRNREYEEDACYDLFTNRSSEAIASVRAAGTRLDNAGWAALVRAVNSEAVHPETVEQVDQLIKESEQAIVNDLKRLEDRDAWVVEGRPLPCPITLSG